VIDCGSGFHFRRLVGPDDDGSGALVGLEELDEGLGTGRASEASEENNFDGALFTGLVETTGAAAGSISNGDSSRIWTLRTWIWKTCPTHEHLPERGNGVQTVEGEAPQKW